MAFLPQPVWAQGQFGIRNSPGPGQISAISGPDNARLGTVARIAIPQGYRLVDKEGARIILERSGNPVPGGLVGILTPESGQWWAVLEFSDIGYLKDVDKQPMDPAAILQAMQKRNDRENHSRVDQGASSIISVEWKRPPSYDAAAHCLEWAVQAESQSAKTINNTVLLFGRTGVLEVTAVQPYQPGAELAPLKELVKNITFKEEQRYTDYRSGDKLAGISLLALIVDDKPEAGKALAAGSRFSAWVSYPLIGGLVIIGVTVFYLTFRPRKAHRSVHSNGGATAASLALSNGSANGNGTKAGNSHGRSRGRPKRVFDYGRFYTDFVMSTHLAMSRGLVTTSDSNGAGSLGYTANGNGRHVNGSSPQAGQNSEAAAVNLVDLIASHNALLEEQNRLIQEQMRLIEEKNKFIKGQNEFLERQSAAMENQFSLKLE